MTLKERKAFSKADLEQIFELGGMPSPRDFFKFRHPFDSPESAEWTVHMLTGLPDLARFNHRKRFLWWGGHPAGVNILGAKWEWGYFTVEVYNPDADYQTSANPCLDAMLIDYNASANGFLTRRIRDLIRTTPDPNVMLGKFHIMWRGRMRFVGFFTLTRIECT